MSEITTVNVLVVEADEVKDADVTDETDAERVTELDSTEDESTVEEIGIELELGALDAMLLLPADTSVPFHIV